MCLQISVNVNTTLAGSLFFIYLFYSLVTFSNLSLQQPPFVSNVLVYTGVLAPFTFKRRKPQAPHYALFLALFKCNVTPKYKLLQSLKFIC